MRKNKVQRNHNFKVFACSEPRDLLFYEQCPLLFRAVFLPDKGGSV
jgi:hypothetical protein